MPNPCQSSGQSRGWDTTSSQMRPDRLELGTVRQSLANFHSRIGLRVPSFSNERSVLKLCDNLPFHNTALFETLRDMLPNDVLFFGDKVPNQFEELSHRPSRSAQRGHAERRPTGAVPVHRDGDSVGLISFHPPDGLGLVNPTVPPPWLDLHLGTNVWRNCSKSLPSG
jgi:hypothetical protein